VNFTNECVSHSRRQVLREKNSGHEIMN